MKLHVLPLLLLSCSALSSIVRRDANTVKADIQKISQQLAQVQSDIDAFPGGPGSGAQAAKVQQSSSALDNTLKQSATDAGSSAAFTDQESVDIATAVTALQPSIFTTLDKLVAKKEGFRTAFSGGAGISIVRGQLIKLKTDTGYFGGNVTNKLATVLKKSAPLIVSNIDFHFQRAVDAYES